MTSKLIDDPLFRERYAFFPHGELRMEIWTEPNGGVLAEHVHPGLQERYEVLEGEVTFRVDRKLRRAGPGERLVVPAGVPHSFEGTGQGIAHLIVEADPALELRESIEDGVRLARTESSPATGSPQPPRPDPGGCTGLPLQGHGDPQLTAAGQAASALSGARPLRYLRPRANRRRRRRRRALKRPIHSRSLSCRFETGPFDRGETIKTEDEAIMLSISCPSHGSRVLVGTRRIRSLINTESGIVFVIECYCGTRVVLRTGRGYVDRSSVAGTA